MRELGQQAFPRLTLALLAHRSWVLEPEVALVPHLSSRNGVAIDAGVNKGVYLYHLSRTFASVIGFEPHPNLVAYLKRSAPANATVHGVALSSAAGTGMLQLPADFNELGSLEPHTAETWTTSAPLESHSVELAALDSFAIPNVALLKIDVEGHEMAVLAGADQTIQEWRPSVLIEVEERHRVGSVAAVREWFEERGYSGYFLDGRRMRPIGEFDGRRDQDVAQLENSERVGRYINNFIFFDGAEAAGRLAAIARSLAQERRGWRASVLPALDLR